MGFLYVFIGGGIGAVLRYLFQFIIGKHNGIGFPISTFTVNVLGCLLIGIFAGLSLKMKMNEHLTLLILTGVLGGFTTFSSFGLEFVHLIKNNQSGMALLYLGLSNFVGIALCGLGFYLIKQ